MDEVDILLTSIIILTYNNLEYTKQCIESIRKHTDRNTYELIVIDNNSVDDTKDWLVKQDHIRVILNKENLGFPRGCNQGIEIAKGDNILLLNNDVIVTENWLSNLVNSLYSDERIGAVGPVTNSAAYYTAIPVEYSNLNEMHNFAQNFNKPDSEKWEERLKLIGYCMLIKREVVDKIGLLDERFTPGNFEDDDYSVRIRQAGYKLLLCKDTFIHHYGSVSWKENISGYGELLSENEKKFMEKWGTNSLSYIIHNDLVDNIPFSKDRQIDVLHIGCEAGGTLLKIKDSFRNSSLYGIEKNRNAAIEARRFVTVFHDPVEEVIKEFDQKKFDVIIITDWSHINYLQTFMLSIKSILKDDGILLSSVFNANHIGLVYSLMLGRNPFLENSYMTLQDINKLFKGEVGFKLRVKSKTRNLSDEEKKLLEFHYLHFKNDIDPQYEIYKYLITAQKYNEHLEDCINNIKNETSIEKTLVELEQYSVDEIIECIINRFENRIQILQALAILYFGNNKHDNVLTYLQKAYEIDPQNSDTLYNLGLILYSYNEKKLAKRFLNLLKQEEKDEEVLRILDELGTDYKMKILLTNHHISDFGGSEINIFQLAKELISKGHEVIVGTFVHGDPIKSYFDRESIPVINLLDNKYDTENLRFDLIWAHHWTTLDICIFQRNFSANKIYYSSLSPYEPLEAPPLYINDLDLCLANSFETKHKLIEDGVKEELIKVFANYVPNEFLACEKNINTNLNKICIVSNHVPQELRGIVSLLDSAGVVVDIYGMQDNYQLITPEILSNYSAVITIGKTVQYALGMGIPVYCYDRFGGPGWINSNNILQALRYNFSGRCVNRKLSASAIVTEIISGYESILAEITNCQNVIIENFHLSKMIDDLFSEVSNKKVNKTEEIRKKYPSFKRITSFTNNKLLQI